MLPIHRTQLIGRDAEIDGIPRLLLEPGVGLLTLTGPGGGGKTRLAIAIGTLLREDFPDGVYFLSLAGVDDPHLVPAVIAQELNIRDESSGATMEALVNFLQDKRVLLILDNFEQIVSAAPVASGLLAGCPFLKILITSRTPLRLYGEYEFPVSPLPTPEGPELQAGDPAVTAKYSSVALFVERARAVQPEFALTPRNAEAVARICAQLDGLPLAIELAAARTRVLSPTAMLALLEHPLQLLTQGPADVARRHQSLRNTIQWSYELLEDDEQRLFSRLAVFERSFNIEMAQAVAGLSAHVTLDGLASLVDKSLLQVAVDGNESGLPKFAMLRTIREYALERLLEAGEWEAIRRAHALYVLELAEEAESKATQISTSGWLQRLEDAHDDIRAAIVWSCSEEPGSLTALRLTAAIRRFWMFRGYAGKIRDWIEQALENSRQTHTIPGPDLALTQARALVGAGVLAYREDDFTTARRQFETSAAIFREHEDSPGLAFCKLYLGLLAGRRNDSDDLNLAGEAVALFRQTRDPWGLAQALNPLGIASLRRGEFQAAWRALDECLRLYRALGDDWGVALACRNLGRYHYCKGEYGEAETLLNESLALLRKVGNRTTTSGVLNLLGEVAQCQGEWSAADQHFAESLALSREVGAWDSIALVLGNLGALAYSQGDLEQAKTHFQESLLLYQKLGREEGVAADLLCLAAVARTNGRAAEVTLLDERARLVIERLGNGLAYSDHMRSGYAFHAARCIYASTPTAPWISTALNLPPAAIPAGSGAPEKLTSRANPAFYLAGLTSREIDVLRLVAQGKTNQEIARDLFISLHTVTRHLTHIYTKIGVTHRGAAVAYAFHNDLATDSST